MSREDYFKEGQFFKAPDAKDGMTLTVEKFEEIKTRLDKNPRPCLRFVGQEKPFGLNATNYDKMCEKFGNDEKKWSGKKIRMRITTAPNPSKGGKEGPALRIE